MKRNLWDFCSVERREWSAENGILAKCLCKFKVYFKFLWIFCFMKHGKWIVKTEFAWIFCFLLAHSAQNDKVTCKIPCHTEALAEVSINLTRVLNSLDFSFAKLTQNDKNSQKNSAKTKSKCGYFANAQYDK